MRWVTGVVIESDLLLFPRVTRCLGVCRKPAQRADIESAPTAPTGQPTAAARAARSGAERAGAEIRRFRFLPTSLRRAIECGDAVLQPPGSGARTTGPPLTGGPIRTTPAPTNRRTIRSSCSSKSGFLFHRPRRILFCQDKREWGAESPGETRPPAGRPAFPIGKDPLDSTQ